MISYNFKNADESAKNDKYVMELYLNQQITKREAKRLIARNNYGDEISDDDFNKLFSLGWYAEAVDQGKTKWLKSENLHLV